jgi:hypothetical protein
MPTYSFPSPVARFFTEFNGFPPKVRIYIKSTTVYVPLLSPRRIWVSPTPSLASECAPPPRTGGGGMGHTCLRVRGWGSPNSIPTI